MCRFAARAAARLDREERLALLPLDDPAAASVLADPALRRASWHLVAPDGRRAARGAGLPALARALGRRRAAAALAALPLEPLYGLVARHRAALGRLVPDGPAPRRYP